VSAFEIVHEERVVGKLSCFDRLLFKGHLTRLYPDGAFAHFLRAQDVLLKGFGRYVKQMTDELKAHAIAACEQSGRPYRYLPEAATRARAGSSKEELARAIAARDGVEQGLICVLATVEPCVSFDVVGNAAAQRLEIVRRRRKCLHLYYYFLDREFGFCHVRIQSWFPFEVQVWVNGREWLARQLDARGVGYRRHDNALLAVDDLALAAKLAERLAHRAWPRLLNAFARRVNPHLETFQRAGFGGYYWVLEQAEVATDVMFASRRALEPLYPELVAHAASAFSAEDVLRFLGRKLHGNLAAAVETSVRRRPEGWRVKHRMNRNSIKTYDKASVLRVETTINNPSEFRVLRRISSRGRSSLRWCPMRKGVADAWRYYQVAIQANERYLEALAACQPKGEAVAALDGLCRPAVRNGHRHGRFCPLTAPDLDLFRAVLAGEHAIVGFRNRDLTRRLYPQPARSGAEARRRCQRVSRLIAKLRGHGLVAKVPHQRRYRPTRRGYQAMAASLAMHDHLFAQAFATA